MLFASALAPPPMLPALLDGGAPDDPPGLVLDGGTPADPPGIVLDEGTP